MGIGVEKGEEDGMKYSLIGALALLIAGAFVLSTASVGPIETVVGLDSHSNDSPANDEKNDDHEAEEAEDADVDETNVNGTLLAGGGGWHAIRMNGKVFKDTFGIFIDGDDGNWSNSSFVFQARDQGVTIHALNFTNIVFDNKTVANMTYVHAWGWASYDKTEGFWFHLVMMDNGTRANDTLDLALYKDTNTNWTMDETSPLLHWIFNGLDGGNLWVGTETSESET